MSSSTLRVPHPTRRAVRLAGPLAVGGGVLLATVALRLRDPHVPGSWGLCPFAVITGFDCPGCGSLRAVNLLTHGDVVGAASSNLLFVLVAPVLVLLWAQWLRSAVRRDGPAARRAVPPARTYAWSRVPPVVTGVTVGAVVIGFWVLRNLPAGAWLAS